MAEQGIECIVLKSAPFVFPIIAISVIFWLCTCENLKVKLANSSQRISLQQNFQRWISSPSGDKLLSLFLIFKKYFFLSCKLCQLSSSSSQEALAGNHITSGGARTLIWDGSALGEAYPLDANWIFCFLALLSIGVAKSERIVCRMVLASRR